MSETKCGCGLCELSHSVRDHTSAWHTKREASGNERWERLEHGDSDAAYCPKCADRLNSDGTVTPRDGWIAELLDAKARRRIAFDYMEALWRRCRDIGDHGMAAALDSAICTFELASDGPAKEPRPDA